MLALAEGMQRRGATVKIVVPAVPESVTFAEGAPSRQGDMRADVLVEVGATGSQQRLVDVIRLLRDPLTARALPHRQLVSTWSMMLALELLRYRQVRHAAESARTIVPGSSPGAVLGGHCEPTIRGSHSPSDHGSRFQVRCGVPTPSAVTVRNSIDVARWAGGDQRGPRQQLGVADDPLVVSRLANRRTEAPRRCR